MIYLITSRETNTCKIGYSQYPKSRLRQLQTGNPHKLILEKEFLGDMEYEKKLHEHFEEYRLEGEWFELSKQIKEYFNVDDSFEIGNKLLNILKDVSGSSLKCITVILSLIQYNKFFIYINNTTRNKIAEDIGVKPTYVKALLKELCDKQILIKDNSSARNGGYYINPEYYWKGDNSGRNKAMKFLLELQYEPLTN